MRAHLLAVAAMLTLAACGGSSDSTMAATARSAGWNCRDNGHPAAPDGSERRPSSPIRVSQLPPVFVVTLLTVKFVLKPGFSVMVCCDGVVCPAELPSDTLEDDIEPFLLRCGLLKRTPRGRVVNDSAYEHLGRRVGR